MWLFWSASRLLATFIAGWMVAAVVLTLTGRLEVSAGQPPLPLMMGFGALLVCAVFIAASKRPAGSRVLFHSMTFGNHVSATV